MDLVENNKESDKEKEMINSKNVFFIKGIAIMMVLFSYLS